MLKFFRKYSKQMLAGAMVFLMISFLISTATMPGGGSNGGAIQVGSLDGEKLTRQDVQDSRDEWNILQSRVFDSNDFLYNEDPSLRLDKQLESLISSRMRQHPEVYLALQRDAARVAAAATPDQVKTFMVNLSLDPNDPTLTQAVTHFLAIEHAVRRMLDTVKVSNTEAEQIAAKASQKVAVNIVELPYNSYKANVPAPTTQQVDALYEKGKGILQADDSMGFGYLDPNRVQLEWIEVPRDAVKKAITIPEKAQWIYYLKNQEQYQTTQPTSQSSISLTTALPQSTTRPFAEVREQIVSALTDRAASELTAQIVADISKTFEEDWAAYHEEHRQAAPEAEASTTLPSTSQAVVEFNDKQYLQNLARSVQQKQLDRMKTPRTDFVQTMPVLPTTDTLDVSLGATDLDKLPGIGSLKVQGIDFGKYVIGTSDTLMSQGERNYCAQNGIPTRLSFQPSKSVDGADGAYIYRDRGQHAEQAAPRQVVESKLEDDVRKQAAHDLAMNDAKAIMSLAEKSVSLKAVADVSNHPLIQTGHFNRQAKVIPGFPTDSKSVSRLISGVFNLLQLQEKEDGFLPDRRLGVIDLPEAGSVIVVELPLSEVKLDWLASARAGEEYRVAQYLTIENQSEMLDAWLTYEAVARRNNIVLNHTSGSNPNPQQQPPAPGPQPGSG